jgi:alkylation response protein AidB-like acyl-CoA dehydrogenase
VLKLALSAESESLRTLFRAWLANHQPPCASDTSLEEFIRAGREWQKTLAADRWIGVHWPQEYGGRGLSLVEEAILQEELVRVSAPQTLGLFGLTMVGPVLIEHGTSAQQARYLRKILSGEEIWCQGFSEPGAGSDLAAVKTKAEAVAGGFRITGQKVWTSFAQIADFCFVLCRTSEGAKKHEGLTYLLVPMSAAGISVRPLRQMSGDDEFNEVFFDQVFVATENVVGSVGGGWKIALSTLMYERVVLTFARQLQSEKLLRALLTTHAPGTPGGDLADRIAEACATRALAYSHLRSYANGARPGPEGSLDKLFWSESFQRLTRYALGCLGSNAALGESGGGAESELVHQYLYSRGRTIAAGTSEIQRNIIAERLLELPRLTFRS